MLCFFMLTVLSGHGMTMSLRGCRTKIHPGGGIETKSGV